MHEAWLRVTTAAQPHWRGHEHFFRVAAETMRRILVDRARRRRRVRHGGDWERVELGDLELACPVPDEELLALDEALTKLELENARAAQLVKLCFFTGLTQEQAAKELGVSVATAGRIWVFARAWLFREIEGQNRAAA